MPRSRTEERFELLDATREMARLEALVDEMGGGVDAAFVDINGNRASAAVAPLLRSIHDRLSPSVMVVKNRELYDAADAHQRACTRDGVAPATALLPRSAQPVRHHVGCGVYPSRVARGEAVDRRRETKHERRAGRH